jgi:radical SAM superfamily enzyme YgiQ (UPF0313 family)
MIPAYAATMLKERGHEVVWADGIASGWTADEFRDLVRRERPDLVAIEVKTPVIKKYWKWVDEIKAGIDGHVPLVALMGDHVTALPEESFENSRADYVLAGGDFDFGLLNLAEHLVHGAALEGGLYRRTKEGRVVSSGGFKAHDLRELPFIDRDLTKWRLYAYANGNFKSLPGTYTMAGRDCWWRKDGGCTFCSWTTTFPKFRVRTAESLLDEIGMLIQRYGVREVFDDTGTFPVARWLKKFCEGMIERGYNQKIRFGCNMRPGALAQEEYNLMRRAGFRFILYGLESANHSTLVRINKGQKENDMWEAARMAKKAGLEPHATCMVGYPWETREEAERTIDLTKTLFSKGLIDTLQATIVIPYPGTELFRQCEENGWLKTRDWDRYDMGEPVMKTPMADEDVLGLTRGLYKSFLSPGFIARKVLSIRGWDDLKFFWRAGRSLLGHLLDFRGRSPALSGPPS